MIHFTGADKMVAKLVSAKNRKLARIVDAVEMTGVQVRNHAASGHEGDVAHMNDRYANRTTNLTNSLAVSPAQISRKSVTVVVFAGMEYAPIIEEIYPFLFPALVANKSHFKRNLNRAMRR